MTQWPLSIGLWPEMLPQAEGLCLIYLKFLSGFKNIKFVGEYKVEKRSRGEFVKNADSWISFARSWNRVCLKGLE